MSSPDHSDRMDKIMEKLEAMDKKLTKLDEVITSINKINSAVRSLNKKTESLDTKVKKQEEEIKTLKSSIRQINNNQIFLSTPDRNQNLIVKANFGYTLPAFSYDLSVDDLNLAITEVVKTAAIKCDMVKSVYIGKYNYGNNKPWYDHDCRRSHSNVLNKLKYVRKNNYNKVQLWEYHEARKCHSDIIKNKRRGYFDHLRKCLRNPNSTSIFWKTFNLFKSRKSNENPINVESWHNFYFEVMPAKSLEIIFENSFSKVDDQLDAEITFSELEYVIKSLQTNKAPGTDGISNEFWKHATSDLCTRLLSLFNSVFTSGLTPKIWSEIEMLYPWYETRNVLPESQAGFRKYRGCRDQLFTLLAIIQTKLSRPGGKLCALFVDLARAFDSLNHNRMWRKLDAFGVSGKMIRVLKSLYDNAIVKIRVGKVYTNPIVHAVNKYTKEINI
ncbi:unnamed protein product [Allacma fusca]|uniref:Reverse transcriptase domain-containing protein n=1 Tax=Allacma fusca TaxID=39272 RepID=A0A8J2JMF0_9HEXA|nr:unnamed protein product [Allacma fusca]